MIRTILSVFLAISLSAGFAGCKKKNGGATAGAQVSDKPKPLALKAMWYCTPEDLVGQMWNQLEIFRFMSEWPDDIHTGKRYIIFYKRSCEHWE